MKKIIFVVLMLVSFSAGASEESKRKQLEELMSLMDMHSMVNQMYSQFEVQLKNMSAQMGIQASDQAIVDKYYEKMIQLFKKEVNWDKMKPGIIDIYAKHFTEKEIADMITFYKTDSGKSALAKLPMVTQESMQLSTQLVQPIIPEIQKLSQAMAEELKAARTTEAK